MVGDVSLSILMNGSLVRHEAGAEGTPCPGDQNYAESDSVN